MCLRTLRYSVPVLDAHCARDTTRCRLCELGVPPLFSCVLLGRCTGESSALRDSRSFLSSVARPAAEHPCVRRFFSTGTKAYVGRPCICRFLLADAWYMGPMKQFQHILLDKPKGIGGGALDRAHSSLQIQKTCAASRRSGRFFLAGTHSRSARRLALLYLPSNLRRNSVKSVMLSAPAERIVRTLVYARRNARTLHLPRRIRAPSICRKKPRSFAHVEKNVWAR